MSEGIREDNSKKFINCPSFLMNLDWIKMYHVSCIKKHIFVIVWAHFFFVPISYLKIVLFLKVQNKKIAGMKYQFHGDII